MLSVLIACAAFCKAQLYDAGFHHRDKSKCYCAYAVDLDTAPPMEIHLHWKNSVPLEDRHVQQVTPSPRLYPRYDIIDITPKSEPELSQPEEPSDE